MSTERRSLISTRKPIFWGTFFLSTGGPPLLIQRCCDGNCGLVTVDGQGAPSGGILMQVVEAQVIEREVIVLSELGIHW
jgi:hypothetical protein